tara:strand:+ start:892 stop:1584 length:693 start_codon:yes stop_codon:yes gene_type:complete
MLNPLRSLDEILNGKILLINKPKNWTSFDVVKKIKSTIKQKHNIPKIKIGHAGTLDPLATGLLIVCTGKYTKKLAAIQEKKKTYIGELILGKTTPSYDLETPFDAHFPTQHINEKMLISVVKKFIGKIDQTPPLYSALKVKGERLYNKARRGEKVKIPSRKVEITSFKLTNILLPKIQFEIVCSKGTYIRSIAYDFGKKIDSGAYLSSLTRTKIGEHILSNSYEINDILN